MILKFDIKEEAIVKEFIVKQGLSRKLGRRIKLYGKILINGKESFNYDKIYPGDILTLIYEEEANPEILSSSNPIEIIYEDEFILIVNKPFNLSTQPSKRHYEDNLIGRIKKYYQDKFIDSNIHIINRLDFGTSGLLIAAKEGYIHHKFDQIEIEKKYLAKIEGTLAQKTGVINLPIARDETSSIKRKVSEHGQKAITIYRVLEESSDDSILELTLITGRCHQIRVHLSYINHPIIGDKLYGKEHDQLYLHSYYLKFIHPFLDETIELINYPVWYKNNKN